MFTHDIVSFFVFTLILAVVAVASPLMAADATKAANLAVVAKPSTSFVSGHETLASINDGFDPRNSNDHSHGAYGNWPQSGTAWVQYEWSQPISTDKIELYWWDDNQGMRDVFVTA
ncbi:MAG: hypothetical protein H7144_06290, partial [Burkholderiales bacterium]|nr:hypothetical protein [Phycisphaerae bacterium]